MLVLASGRRARAVGSDENAAVCLPALRYSKTHPIARRRTPLLSAGISSCGYYHTSKKANYEPTLRLVRLVSGIESMNSSPRGIYAC